jgi:hypothetical protein
MLLLSLIAAPAMRGGEVPYIDLMNENFVSFLYVFSITDTFDARHTVACANVPSMTL